jgi:preprotein translocase subunit YajC
MTIDTIAALWTLIPAQVAQTAPAPAAPPTATEGLMQMLPMIVAFIAIMYFLMIRPQQKRDRERREMLNAVAKGDEVITTGGICGKVVNLSENHIVLKVDESSNTKIEFVRSAIAQIVKKEGEGKKA